MIVVGVIAIMASCILLGNSWANEYLRRKKFFSQLLMLLNNYSNNLLYLKLPVHKFIEQQQSSLDDDLNNILTKFISCRQQNDDYFVEAVLLTNEQKISLNQFFSIIGKTDVASQLSATNMYIKIFTKYSDDCTRDDKVLGNLIRKLSVLSGVVISILLI